MNIKKFFNQYRKPILYWFILGVAVLIAGGAIWRSLSDNLKVNNIETVENIKTNLCGPEPPIECATDTRLTCVNREWGCKEIKEKAVFYSQEECEQKTGKSCGFQTCDFIPAGKTFEEVCGKDFKKGWIPKRSVLNQTPLENQKIIGKITFSDIEGGCWGFQGDNGEHFLIGGDDKIIEEIKKIPNILSKNVEIQGKIEKDIVSYCPVRDGLFKLESYRIINNNAADISDWKTYRNEEYGFEIKYPNDWIADERALYGKFAMLQLGSINNIDYPTVPPEGMELTFHSLNDEISCFDSKKQILKFGEHNFEKCYAKDISGDLYLAQVKGEKYNYRFLCILYSAKEKMCDQILTTFKFIE